MTVNEFIHQILADGEGSGGIILPNEKNKSYEVVAQIWNGELQLYEEFQVESTNWEHDEKQVVLTLV